MRSEVVKNQNYLLLWVLKPYFFEKFTNIFFLRVILEIDHRHTIKCIKTKCIRFIPCCIFINSWFPEG